MIRVSKYPRLAIGMAIIGIFVLPKLHYPNRLTEDISVLLFYGFLCVWSLKHGCELFAERKQIQGELTPRQRMRYRISINMLMCGILGFVFLIFFALFQSSFRVSDWTIVHWGLKGR